MNAETHGVGMDEIRVDPDAPILKNGQISDPDLSSQETPDFQIERRDWTLFRSINTLPQKAGVQASRLRRLTPFMPITSDGKAPDFSGFGAAIAKAMGSVLRKIPNDPGRERVSAKDVGESPRQSRGDYSRTVREEIEGATVDWRSCVDELATECADKAGIDADGVNR
jgi:hypothetical protein